MSISILFTYTFHCITTFAESFIVIFFCFCFCLDYFTVSQTQLRTFRLYKSLKRFPFLRVFLFHWSICFFQTTDISALSIWRGWTIFQKKENGIGGLSKSKTTYFLAITVYNEIAWSNCTAINQVSKVSQGIQQWIK